MGTCDMTKVLETSGADGVCEWWLVIFGGRIWSDKKIAGFRPEPDTASGATLVGSVTREGMVAWLHIDP